MSQIVWMYIWRNSSKMFSGLEYINDIMWTRRHRRTSHEWPYWWWCSNHFYPGHIAMNCTGVPASNLFYPVSPSDCCPTTFFVDLQHDLGVKIFSRLPPFLLEMFRNDCILFLSIFWHRVIFAPIWFKPSRICGLILLNSGSRITKKER